MSRLLTYCIDDSVLEKKKILLGEFITRHSKNNIFQTLKMYEIYRATKNYDPMFLLVENENKEIVASLLVVIQKEHSGVVGKLSSRAIIWGGPLIKDDDLDILDCILKEYNRIIKKKAIYTQFRNLWLFNNAEIEVFQNSGFCYKEHLDIVHDLTKPKEEQFMQMHKGRRKNIRRAEAYGVVLKEISNKKELIASLKLISETYNKVKLPMPDESLFFSAYENLKCQGYVKFFKAVYEDRTIGVRFVFCYNNLIYDWFAGADDGFLDKYPNDFLPWKVMEWGHDNGYKIFDFGGAGKPNILYGVRDYKLKFGGELVNWGRFEKINRPVLLKIAKFGFEIWKKIK
ncbi:MAG: GNAT family N-acetyltransferase [Candidatus Cloacimonetes bacterium]|nr:GNAT family N-acetyltransferase [Candidatus Cloacimonadota bacterium]